MADFYSVLKTSIIQRDLRSAVARHEVYDQAREAMIRRLWSLDPPLSEDEIDARIGSFDAAVEKIEDDLERSFSAAKAARLPDQPRNVRRAPLEQPVRSHEVYEENAYATAVDPSPVRQPQNIPTLTYRNQGESTERGDRYNGPRRQISPRDGPRDRRASSVPGLEDTYDRRHAVSPSGTIDSGLPPDSMVPVYGQPARPLHDYDNRDYFEPQYEEDFASSQFGDQPSPAVETADAEGAYGEISYQSGEFRETWYEDANYDQPPYEEAAYYDYADQDYDSAAPSARSSGAYDAGRSPGLRTEEAYQDGFEPATSRHRARAHGRRSAKPSRGKVGTPSRRTSGRSMPILAIAIGVLALVLIAFNAYVFLPILFGSDPSRSESAASPTKIEDRLPALDMSEATSARIVSNTATAVEIPERNVNVAESLVIFNGSDPTVFEGTSNNPIQFDSDSEGGFARISSATSAAGARAIIGPGLADRLAGRNVRVILLARSSTENGAAKMRFAYQSGLAVSHWQSADLSPNYGTYGMIWRVPAADTAAGDYLLIEPGIPGDGTSADIRMIKIDILAP